MKLDDLAARVAHEEGQTMSEYAFLLGLVTLAGVGAFEMFGLAVLRILGNAVREIVR